MINDDIKIPDELIKRIAAEVKEREEWLKNLKVGSQVVIRTSGQGFFDRYATIISINDEVIETDSETDPVFDNDSDGYAIEERQKYSFPAWIEVPGGLAKGGEYK